MQTNGQKAQISREKAFSMLRWYIRKQACTNKNFNQWAFFSRKKIFSVPFNPHGSRGRIDEAIGLLEDGFFDYFHKKELARDISKKVASTDTFEVERKLSAQLIPDAVANEMYKIRPPQGKVYALEIWTNPCNVEVLADGTCKLRIPDSAFAEAREEGFSPGSDFELKFGQRKYHAWVSSDGFINVNKAHRRWFTFDGADEKSDWAAHMFRHEMGLLIAYFWQNYNAGRLPDEKKAAFKEAGRYAICNRIHEIAKEPPRPKERYIPADGNGLAKYVRRRSLLYGALEILFTAIGFGTPSFILTKNRHFEAFVATVEGWLVESYKKTEIAAAGI